MQNKIITESINIGIDFGTSYSKVCSENKTTKQKKYIKLVKDNPKPEYKRSRVYFDYVNKIFYYQSPKNIKSIETINYFKYSIIDKSLQRSKFIPLSNPETIPEILCCVFFIACLIKQSKKNIENQYKKHVDLRFIWNITLGVPIDNYSKKFKSLFDLILQYAIKLSEKEDFKKYTIALNDLDDFCQKNKEIMIPGFKKSQNNTLSELYAECLAFLEDSNVTEGLYAIVDIGGATVDMAVINKTQDETNNGKFKYSIIAENIEPLGIEILIQKIMKKDDMYEEINELLKNNDFQCTDIEYNKVEQQELSNKMKKAFAEMAINAKDKFREALIKRKGEMKVILCGGGAKYQWYKSCILSKQGDIRKTLGDEKVPNGFRLKFEDIDKLGRYYNTYNHFLIWMVSPGIIMKNFRLKKILILMKLNAKNMRDNRLIFFCL